MDLVVIGAILSFIVNTIKWGYRRASGRDMPGAAAMWLTAFLSLAAGVVVGLWNGEITTAPHDPMELLKWIGQSYAVVLGSATTIYNLILSPERGLRALGK